MITARLAAPGSLETWSSTNAAERFRSDFPLHAGAGTERSSVVYFEIDPGGALGTHTDSVEEVVLVLEGSVIVELGNEAAVLAAGELALVPAMMPHAVRNHGESVARCVGFFAGARVVSTFADALKPPGIHTFDTADLPVVQPSTISPAQVNDR